MALLEGKWFAFSVLLLLLLLMLLSSCRLQAKDRSFSELDLRKPRKFGTFSFGLRKKKREKERENMSKSTIGLHGPGTREHLQVRVAMTTMCIQTFSCCIGARS